jgi:hypothetical protein
MRAGEGNGMLRSLGRRALLGEVRLCLTARACEVEGRLSCLFSLIIFNLGIVFVSMQVT